MGFRPLSNFNVCVFFLRVMKPYERIYRAYCREYTCLGILPPSMQQPMEKKWRLGWRLLKLAQIEKPERLLIMVCGSML